MSKQLNRTPPPAARRGFTLIEILVATALMLILMGVVVTMFSLVAERVNSSRATIEMVDQLRSTQRVLQRDLSGVTATMLPPLDPARNQGYFEYVEGPIGPLLAPSDAAVNTDNPTGAPQPDLTAGDVDDLLMFTARSHGEPFVGLFLQKRAPNPNGTDAGSVRSDAGGDFVWQTITVQSETAEVCWFVRGNTLYRRVLLILPRPPDGDLRTPAPMHDPPQDPRGTFDGSFYGGFDLSARMEGGEADYLKGLPPGTSPLRITPNTLADLTKREHRYAHQPLVWPHAALTWGVFQVRSSISVPPDRVVDTWPLGLPTLRDSSRLSWPLPLYDGINQPAPFNVAPQFIAPPTNPNAELRTASSGNPPDPVEFDPWRRPHPWKDKSGNPVVDSATGGILVDPNEPDSSRSNEDVILNYVLSFDVKGWDPRAPLLDDGLGTVLAPGDAGYTAALAGGATVIGFGAYVDLGYLSASGRTDRNVVSLFSGDGANAALQGVYDTWSTHYETDGFDQDGDGLVDEGTDGLDNDIVANAAPFVNTNTGNGTGIGGVDDFFTSEPFTDTNGDGRFNLNEPHTPLNGNGAYDPILPSESEAPAPYAAPLKGVQVKIRVFEPDSRQIREVTLVQEFMPE